MASWRVGRVWLLAVAAVPCACTDLLGIDPPIEDGGAILDAPPVDANEASADQSMPSPEAAPPGFDASGVALVVNPSQVSFAYETMPQTVTVSNLGTAPSPPLIVTLVGDTTDFLIVQTSCTGALAAGTSCTVTLGVQTTATTGATALLRVGGSGVFAYASIQGPAGASGSSSSSSSGGPSDGGSSSGGGGSGSSGGAPPVATPIQTLSGSAFDVWGVTSQDLVVASASGATMLVAAPLDGGMIAWAIPTVPSAVRVIGDEVFAWQGSTLTVVSPAGGVQTLSTTSQAPFAAVYGTSLFFLDDVSGTSANLAELALTTTGYVKVVVSPIVLPATPVMFDPCNPVVQATPGSIFIGACVGGTGPFAESIWNVDITGTPTLVAAAVSPVWGADAMGHHIFVTVAAGGGEVVDATGNFVATLDTDVTQGMMLPSGDAAVYVASGSLRRNTVPAGTPTTLATGVAGLWGLSPSGAYALFYGATPVSTPPLGQLTDLRLVATDGSSPGPVGFAGGGIPGAPITFTTDETYVAWVSIDESSTTMFDVNVASTSSGMNVQLAPPIVTSPPNWPLAAQGTNLVYVSTAPGLLATFDTATAQADVLAAQVGPSFALTPTRDVVVYSQSNLGVVWEPLP